MEVREDVITLRLVYKDCIISGEESPTSTRSISHCSADTRVGKYSYTGYQAPIYGDSTREV